MKKKIVTSLMLAGALSVSARTWTSSNGEMEFEGDFKGFDEKASQVTVVVEGEAVKFDLAKLSEKDQAFVQKQKNGEVGIDITALLSKATLHQVVDGEFEQVTFDSKPEYYLLYFSASW